MKEKGIRQLRYEMETWKRILGFMSNENVEMKLRLSEILRDDYTQQMLGVAESFQTRFIELDDLIRLFSNDAAILERQLVRPGSDEIITSQMLLQAVKNMRRNIEIAQTRVARLSAEFSGFLNTDNLSIQN